jgi:mono/diheme cytochrome c family protein
VVASSSVSVALTGYEIGLLAVASVFIVFALVAALVVPRSRPEFPGKRLGLFVAVCVALVVAQVGAVLALSELGKDDKAAAGEPTEPVPEGDAAAGKDVFLAHCGACHVLDDAGTTGTIGPSLDAVEPTYDAAVEVVTNGAGAMPSFADTLSEQQIRDVSAYVSAAAGG